MARYEALTHKDDPTTEWKMLRTDVDAKAQGIRHPNAQDFTGFMWYKTDFTLEAGEERGAVYVMFPGLFNECWLHLSGSLVGYRSFPEVWWLSDYKFESDVDLTEKLRVGRNDTTLCCNNNHHFGGMFRRPFLYRKRGDT